VGWPRLNDDVVKLPSKVIPSSKLTLPIGTRPLPTLAVTVVVKVTGWPNFEGLDELMVATNVPPPFNKMLTNQWFHK
jgi:hypothetical protein